MKYALIVLCVVLAGCDTGPTTEEMLREKIARLQFENNMIREVENGVYDDLRDEIKELRDEVRRELELTKSARDRLAHARSWDNGRSSGLPQRIGECP